ncbi:hypothetical protein GVAV_002369 [Gurleya vavrai]
MSKSEPSFIENNDIKHKTEKNESEKLILIPDTTVKDVDIYLNQNNDIIITNKYNPSCNLTNSNIDLQSKKNKDIKQYVNYDFYGNSIIKQIDTFSDNKFINTIQKKLSETSEKLKNSHGINSNDKKASEELIPTTNIAKKTVKNIISDICVETKQDNKTDNTVNLCDKCGNIISTESKKYIIPENENRESINNRGFEHINGKKTRKINFKNTEYVKNKSGSEYYKNNKYLNQNNYTNYLSNNTFYLNKKRKRYNIQKNFINKNYGHTRHLSNFNLLDGTRCYQNYHYLNAQESLYDKKIMINRINNINLNNYEKELFLNNPLNYYFYNQNYYYNDIMACNNYFLAYQQKVKESQNPVFLSQCYFLNDRIQNYVFYEIPCVCIECCPFFN